MLVAGAHFWFCVFLSEQFKISNAKMLAHKIIQVQDVLNTGQAFFFLLLILEITISLHN